MGNFQCAKCGKPCHRLGGHLGERCGCHTGKLDHFDDEDDELDTLETDLDTARAEIARLTAEVKAMRAVEASSRRVVDHWRDGLGMIGSVCSLRSDLDDLDALRARKVGG